MFAFGCAAGVRCWPIFSRGLVGWSQTTTRSSFSQEPTAGMGVGRSRVWRAPRDSCPVVGLYIRAVGYLSLGRWPFTHGRSFLNDNLGTPVLFLVFLCFILERRVPILFVFFVSLRFPTLRVLLRLPISVRAFCILGVNGVAGPRRRDLRIWKDLKMTKLLFVSLPC